MAREISVTIPPEVLARADKVIQMIPSVRQSATLGCFSDPRSR
jgi:hypothetical protein